AQKKIHDAMQRVLDDARQRNGNGAANPTKPGEPPAPALNAKDMQKLKGIAHWQAENQKQTENLEENVAQLAQWADGANRKETAEALRKAARTMKQEKLGDTMINLTVGLGTNDLDGA